MPGVYLPVIYRSVFLNFQNDNEKSLIAPVIHNPCWAQLVQYEISPKKGQHTVRVLETVYQIVFKYG